MSVDIKFHQLLRSKVDEEVLTQETILGGGVACDYADYKHRVGQIQALKNVLKICDEIEKQIYGSN